MPRARSRSTGRELVFQSESADTEVSLRRLITVKAERCEPGHALVSYDLTDIFAQEPHAAVRRFLELALCMCRAGSAGLSLLRVNAAGQALIRWEAVSGKLAAHEGKESLRDFTPCGVCLEAAATTILPDPQRAFPCLKATPPWISEGMMVPLYADMQTPLGTLWLAHHDAEAHFSAVDAEVAEQLATVLQRGLRLWEMHACRQMPLALLESYESERHAAARDLAEERSRREHAEAAESMLRQALVFKDIEIQDAHHRIKNTIQIAANFLQLQADKNPFAQARAALYEGYCRLHLLADVHQLLHKGGGEMGAVPLHQLLRTVVETLELAFSEKSPQVKVSTALEPFMLLSDDAIALAAVANEAITNAYKHAFPGRSGEIAVALRGTAEALVLEISDDGIGLSTGVDGAGLGLELIRGFALQLGGALVLDDPAGASGTRLTLTVPGHAAQGEPWKPNAQ